MATDGGGDTAPDDGVTDAGSPQDLGHLGDVAEHVREVADRHRAAEGLRGVPADFEVANDRLAGHEELVHEDLPRPDREPSLGDEAFDPRPAFRPDLEVVVDR